MTTKAVDYDELYPGRFLKAGTLKGQDRNLTITAVEAEELEGNKGKQVKGIVYFAETKLALVLNRTNGECIKAMFGRRLSDWIGKRLTLYPAKIESEVADLAVRVRGSPDIAADVVFELHLARKRPRQMVLKRTASAKGGKAAKPQPPPAAPAEEPSGPPPDDVPGWNAGEGEEVANG